MVNVEILTIGNEILLGLIEDTNSNYLCRVVRGIGGRVPHIAVLRDEMDAIAIDLKASLEGRLRLGGGRSEVRAEEQRSRGAAEQRSRGTEQ